MGTQANNLWIPAFAGMTRVGLILVLIATWNIPTIVTNRSSPHAVLIAAHPELVEGHERFQKRFNNETGLKVFADRKPCFNVA